MAFCQTASSQQLNQYWHYDDVIMMAIASQITSLTIVFSAVYSGAHQRKHQSSASLAFVQGIHRGPVNSPHKWPVTRRMFPFDDVIMTLINGVLRTVPRKVLMVSILKISIQITFLKSLAHLPEDNAIMPCFTVNIKSFHMSLSIFHARSYINTGVGLRLFSEWIFLCDEVFKAFKQICIGSLRLASAIHNF